MNKESENTEKKEIPPGRIRDDKGRMVFAPGVSGNPAGKPKGAKHISTLVFNALQNLSPKGDGKKWEDLFVERILLEAINKGNPKVMAMLWAYMDGSPQQGIDLTTDGQSLNTTSSDELMLIAQRVAQELKAKKTK